MASGMESTTLTGGASLLFGNGYVGISGREFDSEYGIQEVHLEPEDAPPEPEEEGGVLIDLEQSRFDLRGSFRFEDGWVVPSPWPRRCFWATSTIRGRPICARARAT